MDTAVLSDTDLQAQILAGFLTADPQAWPELAPAVVEAVGRERLGEIVRATLERVGTPVTVDDSPSGLVIHGPAGRVAAWVATDSGRIDGLLISPRPIRGRATGWAGTALAWSAWPVAMTWLLAQAWTASSRGAWVGTVFVVVAAYVLFEGVGAPAMFPWWFRRPIEMLSVPEVASVLRWPRLPAGGPVWGAWGVVVLLVTTGLLLNGRRHRWGVSPAVPLDRFPMRGRWYVAQGGGRWLNHHHDVDPQRGAIDVVMVGRWGTRSGAGGSLNDHVAYGRQVVSPCVGVVAVAVDGRPDQEPGRIRFAPPYGNHVVIDTGSERVVLAHLRPGSVAVAAGDTVRPGQVLGEVGNSGNTTTPHLHLHVERDGVGLDLRFTSIRGTLYRGRTVEG